MPIILSYSNVLSFKVLTSDYNKIIVFRKLSAFDFYLFRIYELFLFLSLSGYLCSISPLLLIFIC